MKVKITRGCVVRLETVKAGDVLEVTDAVAQGLIGAKQAEPVASAPEPEPEPEEDPKPKRGRPKKTEPLDVDPE